MLSRILIGFMQDAKCQNLFHLLLSFFNYSKDDEKVVMLASGQHLEKQEKEGCCCFRVILSCFFLCPIKMSATSS